MAKTIIQIAGAGNTNAAGASYPQGSYKDDPAGVTGTPLIAAWPTQYDAFFQRLMDEAALAYNGTLDTVPNNQFYDALLGVMATKVPVTGTPIQTVNVVGATNIDLSTGDYFVITMTAAATLTLTNPPAAGTGRVVVLHILDGDTFPYTIALSGGTVKWENSGIVPTPSANDIVSVAIDDGVTALASLNGDYA